MSTKIRMLDRLFHKTGLLKRGTRLRVHPRIVIGIVGYHLLALLAFVPWLFSWSGVVLAVGGIYVFGTLGINIGYHRLLTHRGFACPRWLERWLSLLGVCCWQGTPMNWVAIHRMHHQHSDDPEDPHSPNTGGFFWSHMGWFMVYDPAIWNISTYDRYARDLLRDRFFKWMERPRNWRKVQFAQAMVFLLGGGLAGALLTSSLARAHCNWARAGSFGECSCARCWCGTSPGRSTRSRTCGAIAISRRKTTAGTIF